MHKIISSQPIAILGKTFSVAWFGFLVLGAIDIVSGGTGLSGWHAIGLGIGIIALGGLLAAHIWCSLSVVVIDHVDRLEIHGCRKHFFLNLSDIQEVALAWNLGNPTLAIRPKPGVAHSKPIHFYPSKAPQRFTPPQQHPVLLDLRRRVAECQPRAA